MQENWNNFFSGILHYGTYVNMSCLWCPLQVSQCRITVVGASKVLYQVYETKLLLSLCFSEPVDFPAVQRICVVP